MSLKRASAARLTAPCISGTDTSGGIRNGTSAIQDSRTIMHNSVDD